jgi:hypothetical protein
MPSKQPLYCKSTTKYMARELHISTLYPLFSGFLSIPEPKQYWFLCSLQENTDTSEIHQLTKQRDFSVFVPMERIYGVDRDKNVIKKNKKYYPKVNWRAGEWDKTVRTAAGKENKYFNPALVYLDTTSFEDKEPAVDLLKETLNFCQKNTLLICNVMMNNPRAGLGEVYYDPDIIIDNLLKSDNEEAFKDWNISPDDKSEKVFHSYQYQTSCTVMRSYIFFKGVFPKDSDLFDAFEKHKEWCDLTFI